MDPVAEIKKIYQHTSRGTIARDLERAIELLKMLDTDDERMRAAVYMDGLSQMRSEWKAGPAAEPKAPAARNAGKK